MKRKAILWILIPLAVMAPAAFPGMLPSLAWMAVVMAGWLLFVFLFVDLLLGRWLRHRLGQDISLRAFLWQNISPIATAACLAGSVFTLSMLRPLAGNGGLQPAILTAAGILLGLAIVTLGLPRVPRFGLRRDDPVRELYLQLSFKPFRRQLRETWDFQTACGLRLMPPFLALVGVGMAAWLVSALCCAGIWSLSAHLSGEPSFIDPGGWPNLARIAVILFAYSTGLVFSMTILALFRMMHRARRTGRFRVGAIWREIGYAFETVGPLATAGWTLIVTIALILVAGFGFGASILAAEMLLLPPPVPVVAGVVLFVVAVWFVLLLPHLYVFPVLVTHDCGWTRALDVSIEMIRLEGFRSLLKALIATGYAITIVGIPGAIHLLLVSLDYGNLLVALVLGEKTWKEVQAELSEDEMSRPTALKKYHDLLQAGRYLDALNGFQNSLRQNRENLDALRGESLAYLYMGNPRARESLERWNMLDPADEEAIHLLDELAAGLWSDDGERYLEAQKRCTQPIGRGIGSTLRIGHQLE